MEKTYKRVPFDIELAKKIQSREVEGRIVTSKLNNRVRILCDDLVARLHPDFRMICAILRNEDEYILCFRLDGTTTNTDEGKLVIELLEEAPKHEFKPFDRVLVRDSCTEIWRSRLYDKKSNSRNWHFCQDGHGWLYCIPYEGNEHLAGTTDKPKEE